MTVLAPGPSIGSHRVVPFSSPVSSPTAENGYFVVSMTCRTQHSGLLRLLLSMLYLFPHALQHL